MGLAERVAEISGENPFACYQCGKCSASCPLVGEMDLMPNQVLRLLQLDDERVLASTSIWLCTSCLMCTLRCPRRIDVAKVMDSLRQMVLRKGVDKVQLRKVPELRAYPQIALVALSRKQTG